jgi:hypothetical protein
VLPIRHEIVGFGFLNPNYFAENRVPWLTPSMEVSMQTTKSPSGLIGDVANGLSLILNALFKIS